MQEATKNLVLEDRWVALQEINQIILKVVATHTEPNAKYSNVFSCSGLPFLLIAPIGSVTISDWEFLPNSLGSKTDQQWRLHWKPSLRHCYQSSQRFLHPGGRDEAAKEEETQVKINVVKNQAKQNKLPSEAIVLGQRITCKMCFMIYRTNISVR